MNLDLEEAINVVLVWEARLKQIIMENNGYQSFVLNKEGAEAILFLLERGKEISFAEKMIKDLANKYKEEKEGVE